MRKALGLTLLALLAGCAGPSLLYEDKGDLSIAPLGGRLVRITKTGLATPGPIRLPQASGGLIFLNDTRDRVISVRFPGFVLPLVRCGPTSVFSVDATTTFTAEPLSPGGSASLCFHEQAELPFEIHGLEGGVVQGVVVVGQTW